MKVLVVEDCAMLAEFVVEVLRGAGHDAVVATDADWASPERLRARVAVEAAEVVLLDLNLAGVDGFPLALDMLSTRGSAALVVCSGADDERLVDLPAAPLLLRKPFTPEQLVALVNQVGSTEAVPASVRRPSGGFRRAGLGADPPG